MMGTSWMRGVSGMLSVTLLTMSILVLSGCGTNEPGQQDAQVSADAAEHKDDHDHADDHSGWWCKEHGVPEGICTRCSTQLAASFQKKGDWCEEHKLPDSQCFKCHPELEAKFAAQYEAKYGEKPPKPTE